LGPDEQSVHSLFETHGTVGQVKIVTDRDTGQPRGFGFVEMSNDAEAQKAIDALNGRDLDGKTLNVNETRPNGDGGGRVANGGGGFRRSRW
jgi:cold-inducible RNA-binding protein